MNQVEAFKKECAERVKLYSENAGLIKSKDSFMQESTLTKYSYNFCWMGRPIIQYPQDIVAMQELIWDIKPDLIIETGIAHGGSLIFSASMLSLLEVSGVITKGVVVGIDIDIRKHNRTEIEKHPMASKIKMMQGSSIDERIVQEVKNIASKANKVLVCLDSNHTHNHVYAELEAYAPMTSVGSYCVVFDTIVEDVPENTYPDRPWGKGNNPKTAVSEYIKNHPEFEIDSQIDNKILISSAPHGYLKRIK